MPMRFTKYDCHLRCTMSLAAFTELNENESALTQPISMKYT